MKIFAPSGRLCGNPQPGTRRIGATLPGAAWQRCRTQYATNLMAVTPKSSWPWVRMLLHSVYDQPDAQSVAAQYDRIIDALSDKLPKVADHLEDARADLLAFTAFPKQLWRQSEDSWSCGWRSGICASGYASNGSHRES